ncbi:MAG TPA: hypothetical protein VGD59_14935 [Acidisarcina sp.]
MTTARERLAETVFDSLDAMNLAYAAEAVRSAPRGLQRGLDYSPASVPALERVLNGLCPAPQQDVDYLTRLWGSYFGEVLRRQFNAEWSMSVYPGSELAVPTLEVGGSRLYPMLKVYRRLTLGESEDMAAFYQLVARRLAAPAPAARLQ